MLCTIVYHIQYTLLLQVIASYQCIQETKMIVISIHVLDDDLNYRHCGDDDCDDCDDGDDCDDVDDDDDDDDDDDSDDDDDDSDV